MEISFSHTGGLGIPTLDDFLNNDRDNELEIRYGDALINIILQHIKKMAAKEIIILVLSSLQ